MEFKHKGLWTFGTYKTLLYYGMLQLCHFISFYLARRHFLNYFWLGLTNLFLTALYSFPITSKDTPTFYCMFSLSWIHVITSQDPSDWYWFYEGYLPYSLLPQREENVLLPTSRVPWRWCWIRERTSLVLSILKRQINKYIQWSRTIEIDRPEGDKPFELLAISENRELKTLPNFRLEIIKSGKPWNITKTL